MTHRALEHLLRIRTLREEDAVRLCGRCRSRLDQCHARERQVVQALNDFHTRRLGEEKKLYDNVLGKNLSLKQLEELKARLSIMRQREMNLQRQLDEAQALKNQAVTDLLDAKNQRLQALREKEKIATYAKQSQQRHRRQRDRRAEAELEDVRGPNGVLAVSGGVS